MFVEIDVAQGSVAIAVAFRGLPVYSETKDLCERTTCPVQKGPLNLSYDEYLPPIVPPVSIVSTDSLLHAPLMHKQLQPNLQQDLY